MGNRKQPNPAPADHVERPDPPPAPPKYVDFPAIDPARVEADEAAGRTTEERAQRRDCLDLAVRLLERWPAEKSVLKARTRAVETVEIAEHFRLYLNGDAEGDVE